MNEVIQTLDGWYTLHDFRTINWFSWKKLSEKERNLAINELQSCLKQWSLLEEQRLGSTIIYTIVGQKADFYFLHMRETLEELNKLENEFNKTRFADHTLPMYSYLSVVELSNYIKNSSSSCSDPLQNPEIVSRLKPILPKTKHICFYPMNKRREGSDNWYMLGMEERRQMMSSHSKIGRKYAGKVKQIITGSVGLDDWEWGVVLFSDNALHFKKLIYEMRFDVVSARYGEFGSFYVGNLLTEDKLLSMLKVSNFENIQ